MRQRMLRRIAGVLALVLTAGIVLSAQSDPTVYATKTGAKYHNAGCSSLRSSSIPMTLSQAAAKFSPCKNCKPPVPSTMQAPSAVASPKPAPVERAAQSTRCQARTKKGPQCSRNAQAGRSYCWQH